MAIEFIGYPARHVPCPPESKMSCAAIIASMGDVSVTEAHEALVAAGLSNEDGSTGPIGAASLELTDSVVTIEPFIDPSHETDDPKAVLKPIEGLFLAKRAVGVLYKMYSDPADSQYHWALLTGYSLANGVKSAVRMVDPSRKQANYIKREKITDMVERSTRDLGFYAYALSVDRPA